MKNNTCETCEHYIAKNNHSGYCSRRGDYVKDTRTGKDTYVYMSVQKYYCCEDYDER